MTDHFRKWMAEESRNAAEWEAKKDKEHEEWVRKYWRYNVMMALLTIIVYPLAAWLGVYIAYRFLP